MLCSEDGTLTKPDHDFRRFIFEHSNFEQPKT